MIDITDAAGLPLNGATVTYRIDDGELETADCWPTADDEQDGCSTYYTLAERTGSFSITAEKEGYSPAMATATVEMEEEGCHVEQQHITLRLEPVE